MFGEIILDLSLPEYQDDFLSSTNDDKESGLWQHQANRKLAELLENMGGEARKYKLQSEKNYGCLQGRLNSYHHVIFISGARGTGKTVFLRNAKAIWEMQGEINGKKTLPSLHFMDVIDPTLLNIDDRFSEVIIASVYAAVEKELTKPQADQDNKNSFFKAMTELAGALGKSSEFDELRGIDRIQKYRSGIHLEKYFHQFLIASVKLLGCDAIVLPIDDVDMKIDNAFGVLDDIRCLLSCPLILPLVSGDDDLYRHIVTMKFEDALAKKKESISFDEGQKEASRLSNAYLTKVFPNHDRLPLQPIEQLLPKLKIQFSEMVQTHGNIKFISYGDYVKKIKNFFYPHCNGQERSTDWPKPNNAREVVQLVRLLPPSMLEKTTIVNSESLWRTFKVWAEGQQDGTALTNSESFLYIYSTQQPEQLSLSKVVAFNPLLQKYRYRWARKDFYGQQLRRLDELNASEINKKILNTVFTKDGNDNYILRSMPTLEFIKEPFYLTKHIAEEKNKNRTLIALYTHHDYYSQQLNRRYHIFFSRAFELLFWSMLAVTENFPSGISFEIVCKNIFQRPPFYSIFSMNPTKVVDEDEGALSDGKEENEQEDEYDSEVSKLIDDINIWVGKNKLSGLKGENMIPLFSTSFNKVFSQLNVLRDNISSNEGDGFDDEHLSDLAKRFEYIFINSIVSFTRDDRVINTNVATGANSSLVRSLSDFVQKDKTLSRNLTGIFKLPTSNDESIILTESSKCIFKLIDVMWQHPVFTINNGVFYKLKKIKISNAVYSRDFVKEYKELSGNKACNNKTKGEISTWCMFSSGAAKRMFKDMEKSYDENENFKNIIERQKNSGLSVLFRTLRKSVDGDL
ncbi:antiviral RADAR system adenosine triphosphatase RdrA [Candidatus Symbiopectobacterium sp. NZEC135]|uniref:antiviral RADAR system adenosine triphosphatase RdrA n=1 Tax=Candidatus Symbiopectobacterium sp. NZEC135 TaxID=2820471 RepID=UPI002226BCF2|nr:antiviral RADAR system adenosine triphosphatase RdrA [Candidatus Symbiopectobacterium sp. NZEC135]MCW2480584.1 hypothetical protein [Candidatus Symbiopectobacterium sp. NZEC135]